MIEVIKGFIVDATAPKFFVKKDGTTAQRVTLHIKAVTNDPYPKEIAVNCAGDLCNWAPFAGSFTVVECEYVNRVFPFEKNGEKMLGNDVYARSIKVATPEVNDNDTAKAYDTLRYDNMPSLSPSPSPSPSHSLTPNPLLVLPAPAQQLALPAPAQVNDNDTAKAYDTPQPVLSQSKDYDNMPSPSPSHSLTPNL